MDRRFLVLVVAVLATHASASQGEQEGGLPRFDRAPFVSPRVVQDLVPWISDDGEQVVAIDLVGSVHANRYFGDFEVTPTDGGHPEVTFVEKPRDGERPAFFRYQLVGTTSSGIYVLRIAYGTGGTGVFESLLFVRIERERALSYDSNQHAMRLDRERTVLRRLGEIGLGDRYVGKVSLRGSDILIPRDQRGSRFAVWKEDAIVHIEPAPRMSRERSDR